MELNLDLALRIKNQKAEKAANPANLDQKVVLKVEVNRDLVAHQIQCLPLIQIPTHQVIRTHYPLVIQIPIHQVLRTLCLPPIQTRTHQVIRTLYLPLIQTPTHQVIHIQCPPLIQIPIHQVII